MSNNDKPVFDRTRSGRIINSEAAYYESIFSDSILDNENTDAEYFDSYYKRSKSINNKIDSNDSDDD